MFCGWRLISSKPKLVKLGSGTLEINALNRDAAFSGREIPLPIADEVSAWLQKELLAHHTPTKGILHARLAAKLAFTEVPWNPNTRDVFCVSGKAVTTKRMHRCGFDCDSEIAIRHKVYRSRLKEVQEWPFGWPN